MRSDKFKENAIRQPTDKTISELEEELRRLKEKEKVYLKLSHKMKDLEQRSKILKRGNAEVVSEEYQNQQIQRLKNDIDRTIADTKKIEEDNKVIKEQVRSLENQLRALEDVYSGLCEENKVKRQRIQLRDEQLVEKQNQLGSLIEKRNCNELVIEELRGDISKLQNEEEEMRTELQRIRLQRQEQQKQKDKLRGIIKQLKDQIGEQESNGKQYRLKVGQMKQANLIVKQQLVTLIRLQQKLKSELDKAANHYHNAVAQQMQSRHRLKLLQDELHVADEDIQHLTDQYIQESQVLKKQEEVNQKLNGEIDQLAKEVFQIWDGVKELLSIEGSEEVELKTKAHRIWTEIQQILALK